MTTVVAAGPEGKVVGQNHLDEPVWASIAVSDGNIFIRGENHLFCIGMRR
jgi:hypothetical protein